MRGPGPAATPTLILLGLAAILWPDRADLLVTSGSAMLLLLVGTHLLIQLAGVPFLALGGLAVFGAWGAVLLAEPIGRWPAAAVAALAGAALVIIVVRPLAAVGPKLVAGITLALAGLAALSPPPISSSLDEGLDATALAFVMAIAALVLADRLGRSSSALALSALRAEPGLAGLGGMSAGRLLLLPAAAAGLATSAAGAMLALHHGAAAQALPQAAPAISLAAMAAACIAGRSLPALLLAGLPLLVAPALALDLWPAFPDIRLPLAGAALVALLAIRIGRGHAG